jgi:uncharacterized protein YfbU (UPF0304 family)
MDDKILHQIYDKLTSIESDISLIKSHINLENVENNSVAREKSINLSKFERLSLINQFTILSQLRPDNEAEYANNIEALVGGYQEAYEIIAEYLSETVDFQISDEVLEILTFYRAVTFSLYKLNKSHNEIDEKFKFTGFDGNEESKHYSFSNYFIFTLNRFEELRNGEEFSLNSHGFPSLDTYKTYIKKWKDLSKSSRHNMSLEQLEEIFSCPFSI